MLSLAVLAALTPSAFAAEGMWTLDNLPREAMKEVVGLAFDGNIRSLGGAFFYDEYANRTVSVHPAAIRAALRSVYDATHLADELGLH